MFKMFGALLALMVLACAWAEGGADEGVGSLLPPPPPPVSPPVAAPGASEEVMNLMKGITWLGHDGFRIEAGGKVIYVDPFKIAGGPEADLILITHDHFDHNSPDDVAKVAGAGTVLVGPADVAASYEGSPDFKGEVRTLSPGGKIEIDGVAVEGVTAYNTNKKFHPKANRWLGYVIGIGGRRIYHAGDTDLIPEMSNLKDIDVALLPVSGTYVMTASEACEAARVIAPKVAVPMHWGEIVGGAADAEEFRRRAPCEVVVLEKGK